MSLKLDEGDEIKKNVNQKVNAGDGKTNEIKTELKQSFLCP